MARVRAEAESKMRNGKPIAEEVPAERNIDIVGDMLNLASRLLLQQDGQLIHDRASAGEAVKIIQMREGQSNEEIREIVVRWEDGSIKEDASNR